MDLVYHRMLTYLRTVLRPGAAPLWPFFEMHKQKSLNNYYRSTILNLREHAIFSRPLLHGYYNSDVKPYQVKRVGRSPSFTPPHVEYEPSQMRPDSRQSPFTTN